MERKEIMEMLSKLSASAGGSLINRVEKHQKSSHGSVLFIGLGVSAR